MIADIPICDPRYIVAGRKTEIQPSMEGPVLLTRATSRLPISVCSLEIRIVLSALWGLASLPRPLGHCVQQGGL